MVLFVALLAAVYAMYRGLWVITHLLILILFLCKVYFTLTSYVDLNGNYDYYHNMFCVVYLFIPYKVFFARLTLVFFYFLSTATKIHPSWVLGQYFTALKNGLPIFPAGSEIFMTNLVVFMEMVGAWFLFSSNKVIQRLVFVFFVAFHLYSGILVGYRYPSIAMTPLLILFGPWFTPSLNVPIDRRSIPGWALMSALLGLQMIPHLIEGDEKMTMEGNFYGLYMFEANHQCYGAVTRGDAAVFSLNSHLSHVRCDPYAFWFRAKSRFCSSALTGDKYRIVFNHSINGGPFYEIVDESDLCSLTYQPFSHNAWIKDEKLARPVARPVQNYSN